MLERTRLTLMVDRLIVDQSKDMTTGPKCNAADRIASVEDVVKRISASAIVTNHAVQNANRVFAHAANGFGHRNRIALGRPVFIVKTGAKPDMASDATDAAHTNGTG